eukprot:15446760-Alexandrium_andersonii.AAC.1
MSTRAVESSNPGSLAADGSTGTSSKGPRALGAGIGAGRPRHNPPPQKVGLRPTCRIGDGPPEFNQNGCGPWDIRA